MLGIQGRGAYIFPSYLTKNSPNFSGYSCLCHETGIINWQGNYFQWKMNTNFWTVWHYVFVCTPFSVTRMKDPSEPAEYWEQTWFDVLTNRNWIPRAAVSGDCFRKCIFLQYWWNSLFIRGTGQNFLHRHSGSSSLWWQRNKNWPGCPCPSMGSHQQWWHVDKEKGSLKMKLNEMQQRFAGWVLIMGMLSHEAAEK